MQYDYKLYFNFILFQLIYKNIVKIVNFIIVKKSLSIEKEEEKTCVLRHSA
jgi:hypothetical protein